MRNQQNTSGPRLVVIHHRDEHLLPLLTPALDRVGLQAHVVGDLTDNAVEDRAVVILMSVATAADWRHLQRVTASRLPVVVLLAASMPALYRRALSTGATGVATTADGAPHVAWVLQAAAAGYALVRPAVLKTQGPTAPLLRTDERALLRGFAEGLSADELASQYGCSERTIYRRLRRVCARLDVRSRNEAISVAQRLGLLSVASP